MRILILANNDIGLYRFRRELIERLLSDDNNVFISLPNGEYIPELVKLGCEYIETDFDRRSVNPIKDAGLLKHYISIIRQKKPDVVLTYTIKPNVYGGIACRLCKTPYIANVTGLGTSIENPGLVQKIALALYKIGLKKAACVFFQNKPNCDYFKRRVLSTDAHTRIIPGSGVNLKEHQYEPYPSESDGLRFLFIGRIMKDKGVEELFEAAEVIKAKHPQTSFRLIGGCDEDYDSRMEQLTKAGIIEALGTQMDVHSYIKDSHCTVLPSYHEGTSNVLLESAACGRPVIATQVTGCAETFDEGISGLGCEARNAKDLAAKIEQFIGMSEAEHKAMGRAGRAKMEREYDRQTVINAYLDETNKAMNTEHIGGCKQHGL